MKDILIPQQGWINSTPRLSIPSSKDQNLFFKLMGKTAVFFGRNEVPDIFKVMSLNSRLFWPWLHFASRLMPYGKLSGRERELIILRVAWLCRCRYEWGQHIEIGLKNGLSDNDIVNISIGAIAFSSEKEKALLYACDEWMKQHLISENTWNILRKFYADETLIEISMLIGHYQMLAGFLNSAGLRLENSAENVLKEFNNRIKDISSKS